MTKAANVFYREEDGVFKFDVILSDDGDANAIDFLKKMMSGVGLKTNVKINYRTTPFDVVAVTLELKSHKS
ncbi:MAG: hypothetical protein GXP44_01620 [bacterium]|nr:hypothetical protein [bacterium]